jgi:hypothetical protein
VNRKNLATSERRLFGMEDVPPAMVALTDQLGAVAMEFMQRLDAMPGKYTVEIKQDGSLLSIKAHAQTWEPGEGEPVPPSYEALGEMHAQIAESAAAYLAESGERPPLMADMYDRFASAGFDMSMVERVSEPRALQ